MFKFITLPWPWFWAFAEPTRRLLLLTAAISTAVTATAVATIYWQDSQSLALEAELGSLYQQKIATVRDSTSKALIEQPWWLTLPAHGHSNESGSDAARLQAAALSNAAELGILVRRMTIAAPSTSQDTAQSPPFQTTELQLELRGTYPNIKLWLRETLARQPNGLAIQSVDFRRTDAGDAGIDASITLQLFERRQHRE